MTDLTTAANRLSKWRSVFAGWQLGTRPRGDGETEAVRDHRELSLLMRAELNALVGLLVDKGVFTGDEWVARLAEECEYLSAEYEKRFPGFHPTDEGMDIDIAVATETMRKFGFPP